MRINIDPDAIMRRRGLGPSNEAQIFLANMVAKLCDPYVPFAPGAGVHLKSNPEIASDGSTVTYHGPYAAYQYYGEVMVGEDTGSAYAKSGEKKRGTGRAIKYQGAPNRGKRWNERMMAERGKEIKLALARKLGGKAK